MDTPLDLETACTRLCIDFATGVDERDYGRAIGAFAPDGLLRAPSGDFRGQAQIAGYLNARSSTIVTRHLCTNFRFAMQTDSIATGICYLLLLKRENSSNAKYPLPTPAVTVAEYHDIFVSTPAGWRIGERRVNVVFDPS